LIMNNANEGIKVGNMTLYDSNNTYASVNDRFNNYMDYVGTLSENITDQVSHLTALLDQLEEKIDQIELNLDVANESLNNVTNVFNSFPATDCYYYCISRRTTTPRPTVSTSPGPTQYRPCDQLQCFNNGTCQQNENGAFCVCPGNLNGATQCANESCTFPGTSPVRPGPFNSQRTDPKPCRWIATGNNITMEPNPKNESSFTFAGGDTLEILNSQQAGICTTFNSATDYPRFESRLKICVNGQTQVQFNLASTNAATFFKLNVFMTG